MTTNDNSEQVTLQRRLDELQALATQLKNDRTRMQNEHDQHTQAIQQLLTDRDVSTREYLEAQTGVDTIQAQVEELQEQKQQLNTQLESNVNERKRNQSDLIQLELNLDEVGERHNSLMKRSEWLRARQSDMKCKVCGKRTVEFALLPCFHYCYCQSCAVELTVCIICKVSKQGVQKIYYG
ncbi:hypothetical protein BDB00DRAFT_784288 [Zychaea mexicana]|uniref:uncharacterized protein n=1 Tax=Zychaea mexicana TaxID=64656 RepID=UPI0022FE090B|nr:uncharacterized protein BDB00DRAFT_784288 [Zychaea mexicana]KAI9498228.1 hypothetical protein BDB00DRAFT_784288 [Zychaea mexicana]